MENSALNLAHQQSRSADVHLRARRFEEAVECHKKAANLLSEAMGSTQQPKALESLSLQQQHHLRQTDIIKLKKAQYEKYILAMEKNKLNNEAGSAMVTSQDSNLHVAIFRTMEEADSLMDQLLQRNEEDEIDTPTPATPPIAVKGSKQPKDDKMVVEELRTLTQHLHDLVIQLVTQLDAKNEENETLKQKIKILTESLNNSTTSSNAIASSNVPNDSPYVFSPCGDLSPDVTPTASQPGSYKSLAIADRTLPILAPLEMPSFDFSVFQKENSISKDSPDLSQ